MIAWERNVAHEGYGEELISRVMAFPGWGEGPASGGCGLEGLGVGGCIPSGLGLPSVSF